MTDPLLVIVGPTASGKSGLALELAARLKGNILNGDSVQVYRGLPLLTAQPSPEAQAQVPHHLYGVISPPQKISVGAWVEQARDLARTLSNPILVGGSGLYIKGFLEGISPLPEVPASVREEAMALRESLGVEEFFVRLGELDPEVCQRLNPGDTHRVIRAYEVITHTGRSLLDWQSVKPIPFGGKSKIIFINPPVQDLNLKIERRFDAMLEDGALGEVKALMETGIEASHPLCHAIGFRHLRDHLEGHISLTRARELSIIESRQYAKRQRTWFRRQIQADLVIPHFPEEKDTDACLALWMD